VEIHSAWGTFEWLLFDAFEKNYRVGIVANSDDHKGRPGVAYPGAESFGTYGGLTCFLSPKLTREAIFHALKHRHHYATTGERMFLDVQGKLSHECKRYEQDPALFPAGVLKMESCQNVIMGDIIGVPNDLDVILTLSVSIASVAPIERIEILNGKHIISTIRPYLFSSEDIDSEPLKLTSEDPKINPNLLKNFPVENLTRIRVRWEGAEFRARKRNASWKGTVEFKQNRILSARSFNFWNQDAPLQHDSSNKLSWNTITSGNFQGFDVELLHPFKGKLIFRSSQINFELPIKDILIEDVIFNVGGLGKQVRVYRYSPSNPHTYFTFQINIPLKPAPTQDDRIFIKVTMENGSQAWSNPMYFINCLYKFCK
jgi:hypothetical protein